MATTKTTNAFDYRIKLYIPVFVDGAEIDDFNHDYYRLKGLTFEGDANAYADFYEAENKAADVLDGYVRYYEEHHEAISYSASAVIYHLSQFGGITIDEIMVPSYYTDGNHSRIFVDPLQEHTSSRDYYRYCGDLARQIEAGTEINYTNELLDFLVPEFTDDADHTGEQYDRDPGDLKITKDDIPYAPEDAKTWPHLNTDEDELPF